VWNYTFGLRAQETGELGDLPGARVATSAIYVSSRRPTAPDHPEVAVALSKLGGVLQDLGDLPAARVSFERALRIGEAALGPDHRYTPRAIHDGWRPHDR
jgi:Tetratricopeptide repeat